jgi:type II secretory pathway component PulJ
MSRLRAQDGFSLIELLVSCGLMIIVLSATLGALDVFGNTSATSQNVSDAQDRARNTLDRMAWELRNATTYQVGTTGTGSAILRADPWDIVIKTVDPTTTTTTSDNPNNVERVRYCLDTATDTLYRQVQTLTGSNPPDTPAVAGCPGPSGAGWTTTTMAVTDVVNDGGRRVFTYNQQDQSDVNAPIPTLSDISSVRARLYVDVNPGKAPAETALSTGVFLRNQNQRPTAACTATPTGIGHVFLNGSASVDPEGGVLTYSWTDSAAPSTPIGGGAPNFDYLASGSHSFSLKVTDSSSLSATATCTPDPVSIP